MFQRIRNIFRSPPEPPRFAVPQGQRVYAVGDVHGRLDLFDALIAAIEADDAARGPADTTIVLLGDLVDRGPDSAGVIASARWLASRRQVRCITGNHEEMFLNSFTDTEVLKHFLRYGGRETLLSYPVDPTVYRELTVDETQELMQTLVPEEDLHFLKSFEDAVRIGDYLFVHAGIRPGVPIEFQQSRDMRWIREPFLTSSADHGCCVVHGHTIMEDVEERPNRIGIDTGAYMSGRLTAIGLEGTDRWQLETRQIEDEGAVSIATVAS